MGSRVNTKINCFKFILNCQQFDNCSHCLPLVEKICTGVVDTGGKFAAGVVDTGGNFAAGVVDTGGNFATVVVNTGGAP